MATFNTRTGLSLLGAMAIGGTLALGTLSGASAQSMVPALGQTQTMNTHISARDHAGKPVFTAGGKEIGRIRTMVQAPNRPEVYAVVTLGGPTMASMDRDVVVPAAELAFTGGAALMTVQGTKDLVTRVPVYEAHSTNQVTS